MISLRVRRLNESDVTAVDELIDNDTAKQTNLQVPFLLTNATIFVIQYNTYGAWHDNKLVGAFEIKSDGEISYLVHRDFRRLGVATEMLKLAKSVARKQYGLERLYCRISLDNTASINTANKLGFNVYNNG